MSLSRRDVLAAGAAVLAGPLARAADAPHTRMGVVIHSYGLKKFDGPLEFLDYCRSLGAGGVQTAIGVRDDAYAAKLRDLTKKHGLFLEGSVSLPKDKADVDRFASEVRSAKRCGADVIRTVLMTGRRYEVFDSAEAFRTFFEKAKASLALARTVIEKEEVRLAVENHKDLQAADQVGMLKKLDSPLVGVCLDFGNNVALLEPPDETVGLLAPLALTTHVKDMGVEEYADGFLLSEVPLGAGFLDLSKVVAAVRKANPKVRLNLEMITRDPLKIPCLTPKYWATLESMPAKRLAAMLTLVRAKAAKKSLPRVRDLPRDEQLRIENENVRASLKYASEKLDA